MRNYWLRIALGALAIFSVGMIGVTLARQGVSRVRGVVEGSGPISLPVPFVDFKLDGQKLGKVSRVVLLRDAPKQISAVELEISLDDSLLAHGLAGCRLAVDPDAERRPGGYEVHAGRLSRGVFSCLTGDQPIPHLQEFGRVLFQPGDVTAPLLLPNDMVDDMRRGRFDEQDSQDSVEAVAEAEADSIADEAEARADSIAEAAEQQADSIMADRQRLMDSLRNEGRRRADSVRVRAVAGPDSARDNARQRNAARPR
jgi:hypothetical protein